MKQLSIDGKYDTKFAISLWLRDEQVKANIKAVPGRFQQYEGPPRTDPIAIVCYGPSLNETWEKVKAFKYVMTCSGAHRFLIDRGIIPFAHCEVDPRAHKIKLVGEPHPDVEYLIASACHPDYVKHLASFNLKLWHVFDPNEEPMRILPPGEWACTGGCSVGLRAMVLARMMGFTDQHIFGMDGSEGTTGKHAAEHPNQAKDSFELEYKGKKYLTTPALLEAARTTPHEVNQLPDVKATFYGEGLCQAIMEDYVREPSKTVAIAMSKPALISEEMRALNAKLHEDKVEFGVNGGRHADVVLKLVESTSSKSVLDYGAGKCGLARSLPFPIWSYDPAIPEIAAAPRPADLVVCFPAGTVVSGQFIEDLKVGDIVGNAFGGPQVVKKTFSHLFTGNMVTLRVATIPDVDLTSEHPVLVANLKRVHRKNNRSNAKSAYEYVVSGECWKEAKDVAPGDWVCLPKSIIDVSEPILSFVKGRGKHRTTIPVDNETAWLLGLYVAEGHTCYGHAGVGRITLSLGKHEETMAQRAVDAFERIGVTASIGRSAVGQGVLHVNASTIDMARLLDRWCGKGASGKMVPVQIAAASESIIRSFITGVEDGDGCLRTGKGGYRYYSITTVSKRLAFGLMGLLRSIGVHCYLPNPGNRTAGIIQGRAVKMKPAYVLLWSKRSWDNAANANGKIPYGRAQFVGERRVYAPVTRVTARAVISTPVFNIETSDNTYNAPFTVHNCTDVLEHIEPDKLGPVLEDLKRCVKKVGYFVISTRLAQKCYSDGRNTHLIVEGPQWWGQQLQKFFQVGKIIDHGGEIHVVVGPKQKKSKAA